MSLKSIFQTQGARSNFGARWWNNFQHASPFQPIESHPIGSDAIKCMSVREKDIAMQLRWSLNFRKQNLVNRVVHIILSFCLVSNDDNALWPCVISGQTFKSRNGYWNWFKPKVMLHFNSYLFKWLFKVDWFKNTLNSLA